MATDDPSGGTDRHDSSRSEPTTAESTEHLLRVARDAARDALYVGVGLAVLTVQRCNVHRRELRREIRQRVCDDAEATRRRARAGVDRMADLLLGPPGPIDQVASPKL